MQPSQTTPGGNVIFGNVGLPDRLTFSTFGAEVSVAQRLESLTKTYSTKIAASEAFANYCEGDWTLLGTETLRGFNKSIKVMAPAGKNLLEASAAEVAVPVDAGLSGAEHVIMLHRESQKVAEKAGLQ